MQVRPIEIQLTNTHTRTNKQTNTKFPTTTDAVMQAEIEHLTASVE